MSYNIKLRTPSVKGVTNNNKYNAVKVTIDKIVFDSKKEGNRYLELKALLRGKVITNLVLQPEYVLMEGFRHEGVTYRPIKYVSDFRYIKDSEIIVEDSKGFKKDKVYIIKKKMFLKLYGDEVTFIES